MRKTSNFSLVILFCVTPVMADTTATKPTSKLAPTWEIWTGPLVNVQITGFNAGYSSSVISFFSNIYPQLLGPSLGYVLDEHIELKLSPGFGRLSSSSSSQYDNTSTVLQLTGGVTCSFGDFFDGSGFFNLELGVNHLNYSDGYNTTRFASIFSLGQRFGITNRVFLVPQVTFFDAIPFSGNRLFDKILFIPVQFTFIF